MSSSTPTLLDVPGEGKKEASVAPSFDNTLTEELVNDPHSNHPLAQLGLARKNFLLLVFAVAQFIDVCNISGAFISVAQISKDIGLEVSQLVWVITSYSLCFSAFLLFAGRLSDLFPAQIVFEGGFVMLGIFSIVVSFVTSNKYGFLILRGLGGISGAMTIPSAYHLAVQMFPDPVEQQKKLALLGLSGALGNILGLVIAGACMSGAGNYRWFFRLLGILCRVFSVATIILLPYTPSDFSQEKDAGPRWKRMDVVGVVIMAGALICFIFALTQGPISGWGSASFIAPFVLAIILGPLFFVWESRIPAKSAILPNSIWKTTNIIITSVAALLAPSFWPTSQSQFATYFQEVLGWRPLHTAAAILPQGIIAMIIGGLSQSVPQIFGKPRYEIALSAGYKPKCFSRAVIVLKSGSHETVIMVAEVLQYYSNGGRGKDYWRFFFPASLLGSSGAILGYLTAIVTTVAMCPPEMSGVASAWINVVIQVGASITLAVQAGLQGSSIDDWKTGGARAWWFVFALSAVCALQFLLFFRTPQVAEVEHELTRERIKKSNSMRSVEKGEKSKNAE